MKITIKAGEYLTETAAQLFDIDMDDIVNCDLKNDELIFRKRGSVSFF